MVANNHLCGVGVAYNSTIGTVHRLLNLDRLIMTKYVRYFQTKIGRVYKTIPKGWNIIGNYYQPIPRYIVAHLAVRLLPLFYNLIMKNQHNINL